MTNPHPNEQFRTGDIVRRESAVADVPAYEFSISGFDRDGFVRDSLGNSYNPARLVMVRPAPRTEDVVNEPSHYKSGAFEAIEVIEAFDLNRDFRLGNAAKYLLRAGKKDDELQDLKKAQKYLARYIAELETGTPAW